MSTYDEIKRENFEGRDRFTFEKAHSIVIEGSGWIKHLLDNQDGTYSTMGHITCEQCDYCDAEFGDGFELNPGMVHIAKLDAYENEKKRYAKYKEANN